jgi:hypothetical protein
VFILRLTILHAPIANMLRPKPDGFLPSAPPEIGRAGGLGRGKFRSRLRAPRRAIRMSTARKNRRGVPDRGVSFLFCPRSDSRNRIQPRFFDVGAGDRARSVVVGPVRTADVTLGVRSIAQGTPVYGCREYVKTIPEIIEMRRSIAAPARVAILAFVRQSPGQKGWRAAGTRVLPRRFL